MGLTLILELICHQTHMVWVEFGNETNPPNILILELMLSPDPHDVGGIWEWANPKHTDFRLKMNRVWL